MLQWFRSHSAGRGLSSCLVFARCLVAVLVFPFAAKPLRACRPRRCRRDALIGFHGRVNGQPVDVAHAAASYEYVSFDMSGPVTVEITASEPGFWDKGVDIQPWRLGLRPALKARRYGFRLAAPAKLSISRPGDFLNHAAMLFLFAGHAAAAAAYRRQCSYCARGRTPREPEPQERRHILPGSGRVLLRQPEPVEGAERDGAGPRHHCLRRPAGSQRRRRLDAETRLALHRRARCSQRGDRWADLHRALADVVHPDEGFHRICVRRSARDRRQPRQCQPGWDGLAGRR